MFWKKNNYYMSWDEYEAWKETKALHFFQQDTRRKNVELLEPVGRIR